MTFLLKVAAIGGILLALLSAYPGVLVDLFLIAVLFSPLWLFAVMIGGLGLWTVQARSTAKKALEADLDLSGEEIGVDKPSAPRGRRILVSASVVIVCFALVLTGIPRRIAFQCSRSAFQQHVSRARVSEYEGEALGRFLGAYHVDRYAADPQGGVYFRTHAGADGIGPDTMSYGFAYRPNPDRTPFGSSGYHFSRVVDDWYVFSASDD